MRHERIEHICTKYNPCSRLHQLHCLATKLWNFKFKKWSNFIQKPIFSCWVTILKDNFYYVILHVLVCSQLDCYITICVLCAQDTTETQLSIVLLVNDNAPIIVKPHLPQVGQGWGLLGICKSRLTNSPLLGTILCRKSPTFCIGIPKSMKILGQMPQPWGQIMLTNRYKSPPIARPGVGGDWQW